MVVQAFSHCILVGVVFIFSIVLQILVGFGNIYVWITNENIGNAFDYVIVGGGSAGAIVAARLSENPNVTVLVIEAGGHCPEILNIPVLGPLKQLSDLDWQHETIPQKSACFGLDNNVSRWPSGKVLGGSTHLNYMIYLKGHKNDYITWKDPGSNHWDYDDISFYYKKAIGSSCTVAGPTGGCTGQKGSVLVRKHAAHSTAFSEAILQAASELNYGVNDLNSETNTGFMKPHLNMNEFGRRWTSDQYLQRVKGRRKNLKILTNAIAEKILLKDGFEAYGVQLRRNEETEIVLANVEVIVSAGTVGSAKLLMLSGIGPADVLANAKIKQQIDLPAGRNLQDHVTTGLDLILLEKTFFSFTDLMLPSSAYQYFVHGTGPFTSGLVEAVGVVHSPLVDPLRESPDLEFMVLLAGVSSDKGAFLRTTMGISNKVWNGYFKHLLNESVVSIMPVLLHPTSVGEITLDPTHPEGRPKIDPRYLTEERDVTILVEGIRIMQKMSLEFDSDAYWRCYVRHLTLTVYHPVGTCKMAALADGGVVDFSLRVHKTNKLRVIDASVMPNLPSANTNAAVAMIAEKGADLIKEDFNKRHSSFRAQDRNRVQALDAVGLKNDRIHVKTHSILPGHGKSKFLTVITPSRPFTITHSTAHDLVLRIKLLRKNSLGHLKRSGSGSAVTAAGLELPNAPKPLLMKVAGAVEKLTLSRGTDGVGSVENPLGFLLDDGLSVSFRERIPPASGALRPGNTFRF